MSSNRREFLWGAPAALFASSHFASAQTAANAPIAADVVDFWVNRVGAPADLVVGGDKAQGPTRDVTPGMSAYGREPLFLHMDEEEKTLVVAEELPRQKLMASGDAQVDFQLQRLRLSKSDRTQFEKYTSGGIYFDFQQQHSSALEEVSTLASSVFSAIFPSGLGAKKDASSKPAASSASGSGKSSQAAAPAAGKRTIPASEAAAAVPLQKHNEAQSIALANGSGKTAFSCFMKDRKKSAFGTLLSAFQQITDPSLPYMPLISIPVLAAPALAGIRALVANLQAHGGNQQWVLQGPQMDIAATGDALSGAPHALRLRSGSYIVVPKSQASALKDNLSKLKIVDGFLVPKEATALDVYDTASTVVPELTYLSLGVNVKKAKPQSCLIPKTG